MMVALGMKVTLGNLKEKNHITYFDLCFAAYRLKLSRFKIMTAICLTVPHSFQCNMCKKL